MFYLSAIQLAAYSLSVNEIPWEKEIEFDLNYSFIIILFRILEQPLVDRKICIQASVLTFSSTKFAFILPYEPRLSNIFTGGSSNDSVNLQNGE